MARAQPAQPAGPAEARLLEAVERQFPSVADFCRTVAALTGQTPAGEESAFYRIIRGRIGNKTRWRLERYASVLDVDVTQLLREGEQLEAAADGGESILDRLEGLAAEVSDLATALRASKRAAQELARRVSALEAAAAGDAAPAARRGTGSTRRGPSGR